MIWIFGDSFSTSYGNDPSIKHWLDKYVDWKGYMPKTFGDFLSEELNQEVKNKARGGSDNDSILESIFENAPLIQKGDIVIIGWSSIVRYRISNIFDGWEKIIPNHETNMKNLSNISKQTLEEILVNRNSKLYKDEFIKRRDFLNWLFRDNILIQWTPFSHQFTFIHGFDTLLTKTIQDETNNEIKDGHYSETGHCNLSKEFIKLIDDVKLRDDANKMSKKLF